MAVFAMKGVVGGLLFVLIIVGIGFAGMRFRPSKDDNDGIDEILGKAEEEDEKEED